MEQYNKHSLKDVLINILLAIVLVLLLLLPGYLCYRLFIASAFVDPSQQQVDKNDQATDTVSPDTQEEEPNPVQGDPYIEYFPVIEDQQAYIVAPKQVDNKDLPILIVYSHGSNTSVTQNMEDQFMKDLKEYGILFSKNNYIFAASNEHGVNWGNQASLDDINNLIEWVSGNYQIQSKVYLLGFSMGGLPTMNYAAKYSDNVSRIALLAPTTRISEWDQQRADRIQGIDTKIWHGTEDVNIPLSTSVSFVNGMKKYGIDILFEKLKGKTHFDLDTEYMDEILEFFEY